MDIAESNTQVAPNKSDRDLLGLSLILLSSILLGIWAVKGTIALRNILLGVETVLSIFYCYRFFKTDTQKIPLKNWIPIIMVGMMFCWVIFHYFFLSRFPDIQLHELKSTWLRSLLASIVGLGTGLAILKKPNAVNYLWLGIFASFIYLFYQYIQLVISTNNFSYHGHGPFIYPGKISGVLAGTLLISGLLGILLDRYPGLNFRCKIIMFLFWLLGTCIVLYAAVYIFDARNGIALAAMIFGLVSLIFLFQIFYLLLNKETFNKALKNVLFVITLIFMVGWFSWQQFKVNPGWSSMMEDAKVAVQIDKYPNWQNPHTMGWPVTESGSLVKGNTYERLSWVTAGIIIFIPENPLGVGVLAKSFGMLLNAKYPNSGNYIVSTHSAWVELTLAFGVPGLILTLGALLGILVLSLTVKSPFKYFSSILSFAMILLYALGELSSQHPIEILYFLIALLTGCLLPVIIKNNQIS
jgi:hypothetical protein